MVRYASLPATPVSHKRILPHRILPQPRPSSKTQFSLPAVPRVLPKPKSKRKLPDVIESFNSPIVQNDYNSGSNEFYNEDYNYAYEVSSMTF